MIKPNIYHRVAGYVFSSSHEKWIIKYSYIAHHQYCTGLHLEIIFKDSSAEHDSLIIWSIECQRMSDQQLKKQRYFIYYHRITPFWHLISFVIYFLDLFTVRWVCSCMSILAKLKAKFSMQGKKDWAELTENQQIFTFEASTSFRAFFHKKNKQNKNKSDL